MICIENIKGNRKICEMKSWESLLSFSGDWEAKEGHPIFYNSIWLFKESPLYCTYRNKFAIDGRLGTFDGAFLDAQIGEVSCILHLFSCVRKWLVLWVVILEWLSANLFGICCGQQAGIPQNLSLTFQIAKLRHIRKWLFHGPISRPAHTITIIHY